MRIRVSGPVGQVGAAVDLLRRVFPVTSVSPASPSRRSDDVRVYVTTGLPAWPNLDNPTCPWCLLPHTVDCQGAVPDGMAWSCRNCHRLYAFTRGLVIEATTIESGQTRPGDWVRPHGGGWQPWDGRPVGGRHEVLRPSTGRPVGGDR